MAFDLRADVSVVEKQTTSLQSKLLDQFQKVSISVQSVRTRMYELEKHRQFESVFLVRNYLASFLLHFISFVGPPAGCEKGINVEW